jgi:outer membrane protein OmpA-like peptidoglycan-associated protein
MAKSFTRRAFTGIALICVLSLSAGNDARAAAWRWPIYCFFAPGSAELSDRCKLIIKATVGSWHAEQEGRQPASDAGPDLAPPYTAHVEVLGYASDGGDEDKNAVLSAARARVVAAELLRLGIPKDLLTWMALADQHLLVPDPPNSPQNLRAQVILY